VHLITVQRNSILSQKMRGEKGGTESYTMKSVPGKIGGALDGMNAARLRQELAALRESEVASLPLVTYQRFFTLRCPSPTLFPVHIHKYVRVRGNNWRHCASPRYADIYIHTCHTSTGRVSCHISVYAPRIGGRESEPALPPPPPPPPLICMHFSNITVPLSYSLSCVCIYICANRVFQRDFSAHFFKFPDFSRDFSLFPRFSRSFEKTTVRQLPFANSATHWRGPHRHHNICIYKYIYIYWFLLCFRVSCLLRKHGADGQTELMFTSISYLVMQRLTFLSFCFSFFLSCTTYSLMNLGKSLKYCL